jgi:predicted CopG family antitoxin
MDSWLEDVLKELRKRGRKRSDLEAIMRLFPSREIEAVWKKLKRIRKLKGRQGKIEQWLDSYMSRYYSEHGKLPEKKLIRQLLSQYFKIKFRSDGKLPANIELTIEKVRRRVYTRVRRKKVKKENERGK